VKLARKIGGAIGKDHFEMQMPVMHNALIACAEKAYSRSGY